MTNKVNRPIKPPGRRLRRLFLCPIFTKVYCLIVFLTIIAVFFINNC